ncbi:hypothetical protein [Streptomyces sp. RPT161]|uniref:hypothetical protein n=1 Tax=Streptomyces sp. RPT161 TaxID=3015993 RepID=UPI0022B8F264|nr:hypothetical protein [Streptomyces sp. RPT161]
MGYTVLYIAFGVVALWLLGEVLLQYKARLRWRLLAFSGFCGVVLGVALPSVIVICLGAAAFAAGQTFVTLSYRRGFAAGWALGGRPGSSRRRKGGRGAGSAPASEVPTAPEQPPAQPEPPLETAEFEPYGTGSEEYPQGVDSTQVYSPMPMPEETGEYAAYQPHPGDGYEGYGWQQQPSYAYEPDVFGNTPQPDYGYGQQQYPQYGEYAYPAQDPYAAAQYGYETPPGGVWNPEYHPEPHIPQQAPPAHDQPQPTDPYDPYHY